MLDRFLARMTTLEALLRKHTWFTEGGTRATFRNPGTLGDGWLERFGVAAHAPTTGECTGHRGTADRHGIRWTK